MGEGTPIQRWADSLADEAGLASAAAVELRAALQELIDAVDKPTFVRTAVEAVATEKVTIAELYRDVLTPILTEMGRRWQRGQVRVWQEHLATAAVRTVVEILYPGVLKEKARVVATGRRVLLASPPQEAHDLGLRMVADRFDMIGWTTFFVGADLPVDELVDAARRLDVEAIVLSSATHYHRLALRHHVERIEGELSDVSVWIGGSAFVADVEGSDSPQNASHDLEELLDDYAGRRAVAGGEGERRC